MVLDACRVGVRTGAVSPQRYTDRVCSARDGSLANVARSCTKLTRSEKPVPQENANNQSHATTEQNEDRELVARSAMPRGGSTEECTYEHNCLSFRISVSTTFSFFQ